MATDQPEAPVKKISFNIFAEVRSSQVQNGLRHNDFQRYRQYCARRLSRIHSALRFKHGKGKQFQKKSIEPSMVKDARWLYIPLVNAERAWSYAMQLKLQLTLQHHKKHHMVRRIAKAARWADLLLSLATETADERAILEAEAYAAFMNGSMLFERESFEEAFVRLSTARMICEQLAQVSQPTQASLYQQRMEELDTPIRFSSNQLQGRVPTVSLPEHITKLLDAVRVSYQPAPVDSKDVDAAHELQQQYETQLKQLEELVSAFSAPTKQQKTPKARDIERAYRGIIQVVMELLVSPAVAGDKTQAQIWSIRHLLLRARRCLYLAQDLASGATPQYGNAVAVLDVGHDLVEQAEAIAKQAGSGAAGEAKSVDAIITELRGARVRIQAQHTLAQSSAQQAVVTEMQQLSINATHQLPPLLARLDTFNDAPAVMQHIAEIPPALEPIPCKPLFFDLAFNDVAAPDLTERLAPKQQKRGGLFGFLRR